MTRFLLAIRAFWAVLLGGRIPTAAPAPARVGVDPAASEPTGHRPPAVSTAAAQPAAATDVSAGRLLAAFQRRGRFVDFLQEDVSAFTDEEIGRAARAVHEGCRAALRDGCDLAPVWAGAEGDAVTVPTDYDRAAVRLTGAVSGDPPFEGRLVHHGWRVLRLDFPEFDQRNHGDGAVLAPAEIEIGG